MIKANEKIMSVKEAAEFLGFTTVHVRNLCESKQLAASRIGHKWLISRQFVYDLIDKPTNQRDEDAS